MGKCTERLYNGIVKENPTFVQMLGMCPTLAVTSSAINGAGMGLSTTCILVLSNAFISLLRKVIPDKVRIPSYIVIIASFVTVIQFLMQAYLPSLNDSLGIYIPLIVVNCIILGRAESYASKNKVLPSVFDGLGMGLGFTIGLTVIGMFRELIGKGCVFGIQILGADNVLQGTSGVGKAIGDVLAAYTPITIFVLAPGAFFVLAFLIAFINKRNAAKAAKALANGEEMIASCKPEACAGCANIMCAGRKVAEQKEAPAAQDTGSAGSAGSAAPAEKKQTKIVIPDKPTRRPAAVTEEQKTEKEAPKQQTSADKAPVNEIPAREASNYQAPVNMNPSDVEGEEEPGTEEFETNESVSEEFATNATDLEESMSDAPVLEESATEESETDELVPEKSEIEEPATEEFATEESVSEEAILDETETGESVSDAPALDETETEESIPGEDATEKSLETDSSAEADTSKLVREEASSEESVETNNAFEKNKKKKKNKKRGGR